MYVQRHLTTADIGEDEAKFTDMEDNTQLKSHISPS